MAYAISARAVEDIYWIYESGKRQFGPHSADLYQALLRDAVEFAADHPAASPIRDFPSGAVRVRYFGSHLIVYEIDDPDILVLRVFHQLQDWENDLF
jgi:toxin ParE1/3/4